MWMIFASGFLAIALTNADNEAHKAFDATNAIPPDVIPDFDGKIPTAKKLLEMLDSMSGLSDEEKSSLRKNLLKNLQDHVPEMMPGNDLTMQTIILLSLLGIVALIFVFFVYKLFKCLSDRQTKREEKKKNKQMKKKK
ncbi:uncharacterized protein LOC122714368 [Apis laboriosa]|uniref:uncharacterized protein LOC122714368 n=1 Tax=Apis laboriosa TaxID=183418 RepID=UPI001CC43761|nr:uncharacterized protein LOC122714368 [Apis laboriosa]XP_043791589.1 uncharacterized protein LOC122714368 [Apis laboriosa]